MEWLWTEFERGRFVVQAIPSDHQAADIITKAFMQAVKWKQNRVLINHFSPDELLEVFVEVNEDRGKHEVVKSVGVPCAYAM